MRKKRRALVPNKAKRNYHFLVLTILSVSLCVLSAKFDLNILSGWFFSDLGWQLYASELTSTGKLPFLDFWSPWAPGTFYLLALAFKIFGVSIYSAKLSLAIFTVISILALYRISERLMPRPFALAMSLIAILWGNMTLNIPYSGWFSNCFGLLAVLGFIKYLESSNKKSLWLMATGFALGMTFSFRQPMGVLGFAAIASATIISVYVMESPSPEETSCDSRDPAWLGYLVIFSSLAALLACLLAPAYSLLVAMHRAGIDFDASKGVIFVLPICLVILLMLFLFLRAVVVLGRQTSLWALFVILIKRGTALTAGFAISVVPWFAAFAILVGWKEFSDIIFLAHPAMDNYKQTYALIGQQLQSIPIQIVLSHLFLILISSAIVGLLISGKSSRSVAVIFAALSCILIIGHRWLLLYRSQPAPFGVQLYYIPLFLTSFLILALLLRSKGNPFSLARSREDFVILPLLAFSIYNFISLVSFSDQNHYQMTIFPWLACAGYAQYLVCNKAFRMFANRDYDTILRKGGILVATSLIFVVPYVEVPLLTLHRQYMFNRTYSEIASRSLGTKYDKILTKMTSDKGKVFMNSALLEDLDEVVQYIRDNTTEDEYVFGGPSTTMFNFLADRRFPSTQMYFLFALAPEEEQEKIIDELIENRPKYCICDASYYRPLVSEVFDISTFWTKYGYPEIGDYLSMNYKFDKRIGKFYLFEYR